MVTRIIAAVLALLLSHSRSCRRTADNRRPGATARPKGVFQRRADQGTQEGDVYVIEFSGTQCAPCVEAMPILSELQQKYPKVPIISVYGEPELGL